MFGENKILESVLYLGRKIIPRPIFEFLAPFYHRLLTFSAAVYYGWPSSKMKIIGVTGSKGKSTVVYLISKIFESSGFKAAAVGSLGFKINRKEWPNHSANTMPGRFRLQKFLSEAQKAGAEFVVLEVTSEGLKQGRHLGVKFDAAVFTNLEPEHIEGHGGFKNYYEAKQELFKQTKGIHVINADDKHRDLFSGFPAGRKIFYGISEGDVRARDLTYSDDGSNFEINGIVFTTRLLGEFNVYNVLAAAALASAYGIDFSKIKTALENIKSIPGRLEEIREGQNFRVFVDYAHTPESLKKVYETVKPRGAEEALICVLGAAGGGRDKWKRPEFGKIASQYCDEIILTSEDPYDENPRSILEDIERGFSQIPKTRKIPDRREAICRALDSAKPGDTVVITGKGSESFMRLSKNKKIPWDDRTAVRECLKNKKS
ncbi:UDP-N-acetylmuramoyl-L-alanyl-D-glutamate--2,6-diaminopimelate ligase [Candidatus Uhrbacteria bacterium]|nr:UDP-N-acetylmuramoyl-L-alanyl-D-glutamate--2,6-diaminopimelate ligase [Candidatus Uhrbacteria bacterium]